MKSKQIYRFLAVALLLLLSLTVAAQDVSKLKFPNLGQLPAVKIERDTLPNGLRLYLVVDKSIPIFRMAVRINGGSYLEPADKIGLASVCGDVLRTGGTKKWTGDQIDELLESVGGSVETSIGLTSGSASVNVLSDYTDLGIEVLSQILRYPVFDPDKIELAKVEEKSGIARRNDQPMEIARREFVGAIYGKSSVYARYPEYSTIARINRDDLVAFHQALFHPENIQIAVWGDFDRAAVLDKIKQFFGDWEKGTTSILPLPKVDYKWRNQVYFVNKTDINQSTILVGHIGGLLGDPDYPARIVMNNILGASFGSRLFNNVRSKEGLAYSAGGSYTAQISYPGTFYASTSTKTETTIKALLAVIEQIKGMQTIPPTTQEMSLGKDSYLNSFVFNFDDRAKDVNRVMQYDFYGIPDDFLQRQYEGVQKVSAEDVVTASKKNLHPDSLVIVVVGNGAKFDQSLDKIGRGSVDTVDITIPSGEEKKELAITPEAAAKGKAILDNAVKAHGTLPNFKKVKSVSYKGSYTLTTPQGEFAITIEGLRQFPDKLRNTMSVMGHNLYDIRNGKAGWKTDRQTGDLQAKTDEDIKKDDDDLVKDPLLILQSTDKPSYQSIYDGSGECGGVAVDWVAIVGSDGKPVCRLAINSQNGQLVGRSYWGQTPMGEANIQEVYSDFKTISGLLWPMTATINASGKKVATIQYSEYMFNAPIAPDAFEKPKP